MRKPEDYSVEENVGEMWTEAVKTESRNWDYSASVLISSASVLISSQDGTLSIIDLASKKVTSTLAAGIYGANRLKFTGWQASLHFEPSHGDLVIYDAASRKQYKRVPIGDGAAGVLMDPVGGRVFVPCSPDNYVAVADLKTFE